MLSQTYFDRDDDVYLIRLFDTQSVLKELQTRFANLKKRYSTVYLNQLLDPIDDLMRDNLDFTYLLLRYFDDGYPLRSYLKFGIKKEEEMKKLEAVLRNLDLSNENQAMAFHNISVDEIYEKSILSVSNFTLNRHSKLIYDFRSTTTLYYDIVLPFHDKNYDEKLDCKRKFHLPDFYW